MQGMSTTFEGNRLSTIRCWQHGGAPVTHLCIDPYCTNNCALCTQCMLDLSTSVHAAHQSTGIRLCQDGLEAIAATLRGHVKAVESVYDRTLGSRDNESLLTCLEKGVYFEEELDAEINEWRKYKETELERLQQMVLQVIADERQSFGDRLDQYRRVAVFSFQNLSKDVQDLIQFNSTLKYYSNSNNLSLKLAMESQVQNTEWLGIQKRLIARVSNLVANTQSIPLLQKSLEKANRLKTFVIPHWVPSNEDQLIERELRKCIRSAVMDGLTLPEPCMIDCSLAEILRGSYLGETHTSSNNTYGHFNSSYQTQYGTGSHLSPNPMNTSGGLSHLSLPGNYTSSHPNNVMIF